MSTSTVTLKRLWLRIVTGDRMRRTRLHTYSGNSIDRDGLRYLPHALWSTVLLQCTGRRQRVPWLGYRVVRHLDRLIQPDWNLLEFGSGTSTVWFARRCRHLVSVESNAAWYDQVQRLLASEGITHVDHRLRDITRSTDGLDDLPERSFDLVIADGIARDREVEVAVRKVKPGGYIFLDNSDVPYREHRTARAALLDAAAEVRFFVDFTPFQVAVTEGLLVRVA